MAPELRADGERRRGRRARRLGTDVLAGHDALYMDGVADHVGGALAADVGNRV